MSFDIHDMTDQLASMKAIDVTLSPAALFSIVGLMAIAGQVPGNPISQTHAARRTLEQLRQQLPDALQRIVDGAARQTRDELRKPIMEQLLAAAEAACRSQN